MDGDAAATLLHPRRGPAHRRQHRQAIDAASTRHRLFAEKFIRRAAVEGFGLDTSYSFPLFADNRRLLMSSGATSLHRPSLKPRLEISHEDRSIP